ncbi:hypothetical protein SFOMI_0159 [Sphingobium fuliginis]|uniref:Uncharacterized protein n=1 Tax=Sphingobium fuliginis (strain ATCC 27551) TaxID=336203 RepID=A0A292Z9R6_SPHSA|nr:hypothetical protein SFOMI_0159 [Sphingobium fuliginis]
MGEAPEWNAHVRPDCVGGPVLIAQASCRTCFSMTARRQGRA